MTTGRIKIWNESEGEWEYVGSGGGSQPDVFEFDLTADEANGWSAYHEITYDEPVGMVLVNLLVTAIDKDGLETDAADGISISAGVFVLGSDAVLRQAVTSQWAVDVGVPVDLQDVGSFYTGVLVVPETVRYRLEIHNFNSDTLYTGPDAPSITVHGTVTYR